MNEILAHLFTPEFAALGGFIAACIGSGLALLVIKNLPVWSGWSNLAQKYPLTVPVQGEWRKNCSGRVGSFALNSCLHIASSSEYLYLRAGGLFFSWAVLQIPWACVCDMKKEGSLLKISLQDCQISLPENAIPAGIQAGISRPRSIES